MLCCENLNLKNTRDEYLVKDISFTALRGSLVIIRGDNGSGKTSLLRTLGGITEPVSGHITVHGVDLEGLQKPFANYISHELAIDPELTIRDNLEYWADLYNSAQLIPAAINYFNLTHIAGEKCKNLSAGQKKLAAIARLLACYADIWLLDEVENNLDKYHLNLLHDCISTRVNQGGIVFMTTHNPEDSYSKNILDLNLFKDR